MSVPPPPSAPLGVPVVYLVDDEKMVRDAIAWLLRSCRLLSEGFASAESFEAALDGPAPATRENWPTGPSCVLLDLRMGGMSGLTLFERLQARGLVETMPVIFLTGHGDVPTAVSVVKRGAFDFVEKPFSDNSLIDRVRLALDRSGERLLARARHQRDANALLQLSEREQGVMRLIAAGLTNKAIAESVSLSSRTVEIHRARIFEKLKVASAVELTNLLNAIDKGW
jgi:two-component system response regulator DctR